jgi:hypothetical protein
VTVAGVEYPLYTHVHHGYGLNDAFDRSVTLLTRHLPSRRGLKVTRGMACNARVNYSWNRSVCGAELQSRG